MGRFREARAEGTRQDLPEGTYKIVHTWQLKKWKEDEEASLQLELRKADEEDRVMWLSAGRAMDNLPASDGKALVTSSGNPSNISSRCRAAAYLQTFVKKGQISEDVPFDNLSELDAYEVQIALVPNTSAMAKKGSQIPMLVAVNPRKASSTTKSQGRSQKSQNGEAEDIPELGFTQIQLKGYRGIQKLIQTTPGIDLKALTVKDLLPYVSGRNDVEKVMAAQAALDDKVLEAVIPF